MKIIIKKKIDEWWWVDTGEEGKIQTAWPSYSEAYAFAVGVGWARTKGTMKGVDIETEVE